MVIMIAANIINIFANYFLVYGVYGFPELGAEGSIWATFIVRCMQVVAILSYVWFFIDHEKFGLSKPKITWRGGADLRVHRLCLAGISMGLENGAFNALVLFAGFLGTAVVAAHVIMINVFAVFFMMGLGFGVATAVSVGNANGAGDMQQVTRWAWLGLSIQSVVMVVAGILMWVTAQQTGEFFSNDPAVYNLAAAMIAWVAMSLVFDTRSAHGNGLARARRYMDADLHSLHRLWRGDDTAGLFVYLPAWARRNGAGRRGYSRHFCAVCLGHAAVSPARPPRPASPNSRSLCWPIIPASEIFFARVSASMPNCSSTSIVCCPISGSGPFGSVLSSPKRMGEAIFL